MLRRDLVLFKRGLIPALVLTVLLAAAAALAGFSVMRGASESAAPVRVAVVDEEGGMVSRFCINLVSSQSYIASLLDIDRVSRKKALTGLEDGTYAAVIILPEGYTDQIMYGYQGEGEILLSKGAAASAEIVASVADFGERLLAAGQYGVFAGEKVVKAAGLSREVYDDFLDRSNLELLDAAVNLYDTGSEDILTAYDGTGLSVGAYYAVTWLSLFLLVSGLFFTALYTADNSRALLTRLFSEGIRPAEYLAGKLLWPLLFRLPLFALLLLGLSRLLPLQLSAGALLSTLGSVLLAAGLISFSAAALASRKGWAGLLLGIAATGLFLCGGLIPRSFLPSWLSRLGDLTPSGAVAGLLRPLFGGRLPLPSLLAGLIYLGLALFFALHHLRAMPGKGEDA
ncbi:MAG: ABC transporter permease [Lachnospiraceae bacterium]|nr:ABC transporter permease [Lachnospiraceae bacterium]